MACGSRQRGAARGLRGWSSFRGAQREPGTHNPRRLCCDAAVGYDLVPQDCLWLWIPGSMLCIAPE